MLRIYYNLKIYDLSSIFTVFKLFQNQYLLFSTICVDKCITLFVQTLQFNKHRQINYNVYNEFFDTWCKLKEYETLYKYSKHSIADFEAGPNTQYF